MSVYQNINGTLARMDASDLVQLAAVDTEGILGGTPEATTDGQTLVDQLAADDVQTQTDIGQIKTDLSDKLDIADYAVTGAVNFFNNTIESQTVNNVVWVKDETAKTLTANGMPTGGNSNVYADVTLEAGTWYFTGCPDINTSSDTYVGVQIFLAQSPWTEYGWDYGKGATITLSAKTKLRVQAVVFRNKTVSSSSCVFKLMVSNIKDAPYAPYAMTNRELTDAATLKESSCSTTYTVSTAQGGNHLYKKGSTVQMLLALEGVTVNAFTTAATVPSGFRPVNTIIGISMRNSNIPFYVSSGGAIQFGSALNNANATMFLSWLTNE